MKRTKIKYNHDRAYYIVCYTVIILLTLAVLYPIIYILSSSFSYPDAVVQGKVWLWPVDIDLTAYEMILQQKRVWNGYKNTIIFTVGGTLIKLTTTLASA